MIVNIDPVPKPRMTRSDAWKKRKCVVDYFAFKDQLLYSVPKEKIQEIQDTGRLSVDIFVKVPKSCSKKQRRARVGFPHKQRPDLDNYIKSILDCLLEEDSCVHTIRASKFWGEEGKIVFY